MEAMWSKAFRLLRTLMSPSVLRVVNTAILAILSWKASEMLRVLRHIEGQGSTIAKRSELIEKRHTRALFTPYEFVKRVRACLIEAEPWRDTERWVIRVVMKELQHLRLSWDVRGWTLSEAEVRFIFWHLNNDIENDGDGIEKVAMRKLKDLDDRRQKILFLQRIFLPGEDEFHLEEQIPEEVRHLFLWPVLD